MIQELLMGATGEVDPSPVRNVAVVVETLELNPHPVTIERAGGRDG